MVDGSTAVSFQAVRASWDSGELNKLASGNGDVARMGYFPENRVQAPQKVFSTLGHVGHTFQTDTVQGVRMYSMWCLAQARSSSDRSLAVRSIFTSSHHGRGMHGCS